MTSRLDLDLLRTFVMVAELGSLTRAGERLLISQPTVSLQLKRLEDGLGRSLMWRSPKGVQLTGDGEILLSYARRILALAEEALGKISEPVIQGLVRLGTPEDFATTHLSGVLARFAQSHPGVALEVTTDLTLNLIERFKDGEFDLVLIKREPMGPTEGVRVWREPLVWAGTRPEIFTSEGRCRWSSRPIHVSTASAPPRRSTGPAGPGAWPTPRPRWPGRRPLCVPVLA
jgi:DNA-binding transcriptional LysR family regulator